MLASRMARLWRSMVSSGRHKPHAGWACGFEHLVACTRFLWHASASCGFAVDVGLHGSCLAGPCSVFIDVQLPAVGNNHRLMPMSLSIPGLMHGRSVAAFYSFFPAPYDDCVQPMLTANPSCRWTTEACSL